MNTKIKRHHTEKPAYIYVRQSTLAQVRHHQESTERQYALKERAIELGWAPKKIQILDADLGLSGAHSTGRKDFKRLIADLSLGNVGAVLALEASRLARSCLDWQRLVELCALTGALLIDEDGCYDPADFNDGLLLGFKGTMAQAELHFLSARLQGGKLNKAKKGELRFPIPVGLAYDQRKQIVLDPDKEVRGSVQLVFDLFRETGSAYAVVQKFTDKLKRFPKRAYGGAWDGKLIWARLTHGRTLQILKNPAYAGVYVFGRFQSTKIISPQGEIHPKIRPVPQDSWKVIIHDHHEGYISWDEFLKNQETLAKNRTNGGESILSGAAREGLALLQGLLICHKCGRKLSVRYTGNGGIYPTYQCTWLKREGLAKSYCMAIRCDLLDAAISKRALEVLEPSQLQLAVGALEELERRDDAILRQWQMRIERAEYEAQLAQRRYEEVDPSNRLVASTLEARWNDALLELEELKTQFTDFQKKNAVVATPEQKAKVLALAEDFPRVWNSPTTNAKDKKRMLRLLVRDITVEKQPDRVVVLHVRWQGGATENVPVQLPLPAADQVRYPQATVDKVRCLAETLNDHEIARSLNQDGQLSAKGKSFTANMIQWIRFKHRIPAPTLKRPEEMTVKEVATKFGVSPGVVYYWVKKNLIEARRINQGSPLWITLNPRTESVLHEWVKESSRIRKTKAPNQP